MRIVCISDTHCTHERLDLPDGDLLIHAGDFSMESKGIVPFLKWFAQQRHVSKILIAGNHETEVQGNPEPFLGMVRELGIHYLQDQEIVIGGFRIWGAPWTPRIGEGARAKVNGFELHRGAHRNAIGGRWNLIPEGTDILATHGPPNQILDLMEGPILRHVGCSELRKRVQAIHPRLHIFGHIHSGHGRIDLEGTAFVNASICGEGYRLAYLPQVVDLFQAGDRNDHGPKNA